MTPKDIRKHYRICKHFRTKTWDTYYKAWLELDCTTDGQHWLDCCAPLGKVLRVDVNDRSVT